jgi:hypothetical protein
VAEVNFTVSGESFDFEMFETTIELPDGVRSFDLTFISGGTLNATGTINIDDISAAMIAPSSLPGDFNGDGIVDALDYTVWRNNLGDPDESDLNWSGDGGDVSASDYDLWKSNYGRSLSGNGGIADSLAAPEPVATYLLAAGASILNMLIRHKRER